MLSMHSLWARTLAAQGIKLNGAALIREAVLGRTEKGYAGCPRRKTWTPSWRVKPGYG